MRIILAAAMILAIANTTGCSIETHTHGDSDDVKIATPFGRMQVKTNESDILSDIGLPLYPGATLVKKEHGNDGAADINMSFGDFQLKVKAADYRTHDNPEKVLAFYKKALPRFGSVIQCRHNHPVGTPTHTSEGLTCDEDHHHSDDSTHVDGDDNASGFQLKAGSKKHQHIVDITPENGGTKFGLVALDLPRDQGSTEEKKQ